MVCPKRGCGATLERRKTVHPAHPRMPSRWRGYNIVKRELRCPTCGAKCSSIEMLERDLDIGGWVENSQLQRLRP